MNNHLTLIVQSDDATITQVSARLELMDDAQTGLRSYLLTGNPVYQHYYTTARQQLQSLETAAPVSHPADSTLEVLSTTMVARARAWEDWATGLLAHAGAGQSSPTGVAQQLRGNQLFDQYRVASAAVVQRVDHDRQNSVQQDEQIPLMVGMVLSSVAVAALLVLALLSSAHLPCRDTPARGSEPGRSHHRSGGSGAACAGQRDREFRRLAESMDLMRHQLAQGLAARTESERHLRASEEPIAASWRRPAKVSGSWMPRKA